MSGSEVRKDSTENSDFQYDTLPPGSVKSDDYFGPNLDTVLKETLDGYKTKERIDTSVIVGTDTFLIKLEHYCLFDSAIRLEKKYIEMYELNSFVTHNFASNLLIIKNGKTLVDIQITKKDFEGQVESTLSKFGALSSPYFRYSDKSFVFNYSLSIPLTDLGVAVACKIDRNGNIQFGGN